MVNLVNLAKTTKVNLAVNLVNLVNLPKGAEVNLVNLIAHRFLINN